MRTPIQSIFAVACLAVVTQSLAAQDATQSPPSVVDASAPRVQAAAPTIGVVDLAKAIEQYPKWIEQQARLDALDAQIKERMKQIDARVDDLRNSLQITSPESDERKRAEFELQVAQQDRQFQFKQMLDRLDLEQQRALLAVYEDLEKAVPVVAKARGVRIVMRVLEVPKVPADAPAQSPRMISARLRAFEGKQVWYAHDEVDLTPDLIKYLMVPRDTKPAGAPSKDAPSKDASSKDASGSGKPAGNGKDGQTPAGGSKEGGN